MRRGVPTESERLAQEARRAVDRRIKEILDSVPCFCTPERPELGREEWCAKHHIIRRLDSEALGVEVGEQARML